jgi:hypothetical protein
VWKNKHVLVAVLVAPVLAVVAWFAVDHVVSEKPHAARPGADYPMMARSNCRYESGACDLVNGEFKLRIRAPGGNAPQLALEISSEFPLNAATVGIATATGRESIPVAFAQTTDDPTRWSGRLEGPAAAESVLQLVVVAGESRYFAEVPTVFLQTEQAR